MILNEIYLRLSINSVFSTIMENVRNRANIRLLRNSKVYRKFVSKTSFVFEKMFCCKNLTAFYKLKDVILFKGSLIG